MVETERTVATSARLTLFGHPSVPARVELVHRPTSERLTRALLYLLVCWALTPVVALVPPHIPWILGAFGAGIYFAWTNWRGTYEVRSAEAECPGCGDTLTLKPGARIRTPHKMPCYSCHKEPYLEIAE